MEADYRLVAGQVAIEVLALTLTESRLFPFLPPHITVNTMISPDWFETRLFFC